MNPKGETISIALQTVSKQWQFYCILKIKEISFILKRINARQNKNMKESKKKKSEVIQVKRKFNQ